MRWGVWTGSAIYVGGRRSPEGNVLANGQNMGYMRRTVADGLAADDEDESEDDAEDASAASWFAPFHAMRLPYVRAPGSAPPTSSGVSAASTSNVCLLVTAARSMSAGSSVDLSMYVFEPCEMVAHAYTNSIYQRYTQKSTCDTYFSPLTVCARRFEFLLCPVSYLGPQPHPPRCRVQRRL